MGKGRVHGLHPRNLVGCTYHTQPQNALLFSFFFILFSQTAKKTVNRAFSRHLPPLRGDFFDISPLRAIPAAFLNTRKAPHVSMRRSVNAGPAGFEPADAGIKTLCLTAWRWPRMPPACADRGKCRNIFRKKNEKPVGLPKGFRRVDIGIRTQGLQSHNLAR